MISCTVPRISIPHQSSMELNGSDFLRNVSHLGVLQRDSLAVAKILAGNIPSFYYRFKRIKISIYDSLEHKMIRASYFVALDYLCIGNDADWVRMPLTPMAAQMIADSSNCFLPTVKMVDQIYERAKVKLEPVPMYAFRDSVVTFWHHHLIIEGQRKNRKGLLAGIKKDVVLSDRINREGKEDRVAIYGWHKLDGNPIQALYTGHVNWYVDYSHGIRLIDRRIKIGRKWMDYLDVLNDDRLHKLICDDLYCDFYHY